MAAPPSVLSPDDPTWPTGLSDLHDAPERLFVLGTLPDRTRDAIAIVGSREPSREALRFARELASTLASVGVVIVSGGARGVDAAAHEGALESKGHTIAILPGDVQHPVPANNRALFRRMCGGAGALVSENQTTPDHGGAFVTRNRLIAAWARAVVVVEARIRSGTRSTAVSARRLGRPVFAVPWSPYHAPGAGGLLLLEEGATVLGSAGPLLRYLGLKLPAAVAARHGGGLDESHQRLLDVLQRNQGITIDELAPMFTLPLPALLGALAQLELSGKIESGGAGRYRVCARPV